MIPAIAKYRIATSRPQPSSRERRMSVNRRRSRRLAGRHALPGDPVDVREVPIGGDEVGAGLHRVRRDPHVVRGDETPLRPAGRPRFCRSGRRSPAPHLRTTHTGWSRNASQIV